jgi:RNA polymerase sigma factor (sigma-70 family)
MRKGSEYVTVAVCAQAPGAARAPDPAAPWRQDVWDAVAAMDREFRCYIRRRILHAPEAEDVLHDFYVRVCEHSHDLRDRNGTRSWLYRVLHSALMDHLRVKRRQSNVIDLLRAQIQPPVEASYSDRSSFAEILARLKPEYSDILLRLQVRADTPWEAAADLGTTANNVRVRHFRARAALRDAYSKSNREPRGIGGRVLNLALISSEDLK